MKIQSVRFIKSSIDAGSCPRTTLPEYAFAGRSNVGKSSLINYLTGTKGLAKTSSTPGKTKLINHFLVNRNWLLADLPGYGYARAGKMRKKELMPLVSDYLLTRQNLACLFLLIDCRHEPLINDLDMIHWLGSHQIPFVIVFTKTDKLSAATLRRNLGRYRNTLSMTWEELPLIFITSSLRQEGRDDILAFIQGTNETFASTRKR